MKEIDGGKGHRKREERRLDREEMWGGSGGGTREGRGSQRRECAL